MSGSKLMPTTMLGYAAGVGVRNMVVGIRAGFFTPEATQEFIEIAQQAVAAYGSGDAGMGELAGILAGHRDRPLGKACELLLDKEEILDRALRMLSAQPASVDEGELPSLLSLPRRNFAPNGVDVFIKSVNKPNTHSMWSDLFKRGVIEGAFEGTVEQARSAATRYDIDFDVLLAGGEIRREGLPYASEVYEFLSAEDGLGIDAAYARNVSFVWALRRMHIVEETVSELDDRIIGLTHHNMPGVQPPGYDFLNRFVQQATHGFRELIPLQLTRDLARYWGNVRSSMDHLRSGRKNKLYYHFATVAEKIGQDLNDAAEAALQENYTKAAKILDNVEWGDVQANNLYDMRFVIAMHRLASAELWQAEQFRFSGKRYTQIAQLRLQEAKELLGHVSDPRVERALKIVRAYIAEFEEYIGTPPAAEKPSPRASNRIPFSEGESWIQELLHRGCSCDEWKQRYDRVLKNVGLPEVNPAASQWAKELTRLREDQRASSLRRGFPMDSPLHGRPKYWEVGERSAWMYYTQGPGLVGKYLRHLASFMTVNDYDVPEIINSVVTEIAGAHVYGLATEDGRLDVPTSAQAIYRVMRDGFGLPVRDATDFAIAWAIMQTGIRSPNDIPRLAHANNPDVDHRTRDMPQGLMARMEYELTHGFERFHEMALIAMLSHAMAGSATNNIMHRGYERAADNLQYVADEVPEHEQALTQALICQLKARLYAFQSHPALTNSEERRRELVERSTQLAAEARAHMEAYEAQGGSIPPVVREYMNENMVDFATFE